MNRFPRLACSLLMAIAGAAVPAAGQQVLSGSALDAADQPIAGAVVVLHSVSDAGGRELDRDTTGSDGSFRLVVPDRAEGVLFAATRVDGDLFVGDTFRGEAPAEYLLRAGPGVQPFPMPAARTQPASPMGGAPRVGSAPEPSHGGFWVAFIALALVGAVVLLTTRARRRPAASRELMLEIARLDRAAAGASDPERLRRRREQLMRRLEQTAASDRAGGL